MKITMKSMSMVTSPIYAPVASGKSPDNSPKTPRFEVCHPWVVGNSQNTILASVSVT